SSDNSLYGFSIDPASGKLTAVPSSPLASLGTGLSAAAVTADGKRVYTVNTLSNYLSPYAIDPTTGRLTLGPSMVGTPSDPVTNVPCGPNQLAFDAGNQNAYVVCPGLNSMIAYPVEASTGMFDGGGGAGFAPQPPPSAIALADDGRFVFGIRNGAVETYRTWLGTVSGSAIANPPSVSANAAALTVHPNGKFVYVANGDASGTIQTFSVTTV